MNNCFLCGEETNNPKFCSLRCSCTHNARKQKKKTAKCLQCKKDTTNKKFCSRSCAASFNNKHFAKRRKRKEEFCKICGTEVYRRKFCKECSMPKDMTLEEATYKRHTSGAYSLIRDRAKTETKNRKQVCVNCAYDKHVEVCHRKHINLFDPKTMISEINEEDNLILLCRNCHWELDNGFLEI